MKKYLVGLIFGLIIGSVSVSYAGNLIGQTVDATYPVIVNGKSITVEAIGIRGVSYLPVRVLAEGIGYDVDFQDRTITLSSKATDIVSITQTVEPEVITAVEENYLKVGKVHFVNLDIPDKEVTVQLLNGEYYINKGAFIQYFSVYTSTITINGRTYKVDDKTAMVKLSDLGLTGVMQGDTLYIQ